MKLSIDISEEDEGLQEFTQKYELNMDAIPETQGTVPNNRYTPTDLVSGDLSLTESQKETNLLQGPDPNSSLGLSGLLAISPRPESNQKMDSSAKGGRRSNQANKSKSGTYDTSQAFNYDRNRGQYMTQHLNF